MEYLNKIIKIFTIDIDHRRVYGLDILRAFAIIVVLYGHSRSFLAEHIDMKMYELFLFDGVTIFFVLSGFLIGGILIKLVDSTEFSMRDLFSFWGRRWFHTVPNYFFILTIVFVLTFLIEGYWYTEIWKYYFFIQNFYNPHPYFFPEAWSLSVEEWFYILVPIIVMLFIKIMTNKKRAILYVIVSIILIVSVFRLYRAIQYNCDDLVCWGNYVRNLVLTRLDSLMYGVLGAYVLYYYSNTFFKNKNILFCLGVILLIIPQVYDYIYQDMFFKSYLSFLFTSAGVLIMLPKLYSIKGGAGYIYKILTIISLISYSMYLINYTLIKHYLFHFLFNIFPVLHQPNLISSYINYVLFWFSTILLSIPLYKYFEMPMTKLRDKI